MHLAAKDEVLPLVLYFEEAAPSANEALPRRGWIPELFVTACAALWGPCSGPLSRTRNAALCPSAVQLPCCSFHDNIISPPRPAANMRHPHPAPV